MVKGFDNECPMLRITEEAEKFSLEKVQGDMRAPFKYPKGHLMAEGFDLLTITSKESTRTKE